jgi:hypothetical protein
VVTVITFSIKRSIHLILSGMQIFYVIIKNMQMISVTTKIFVACRVWIRFRESGAGNQKCFTTTQLILPDAVQPER